MIDLTAIRTRVHRSAILKFAACCALPVLAVVSLLVIIVTAYIEMDQAVVESRSHTCPPGSQNKIPKILHHTWKDKDVPDRWKNSSNSCVKLNPDYNYTFWTDDHIEAFLQKEYPWFVDTYNSYPYNIQKIDAARLFMLYHYGGVYTDLDIICRYSFTELLRNLTCYNLVFLETTPVGVTNMVIFSTPRHPFIKKCLEALPERNHAWGPKHTTVMLSAGPTFISHMMRNYPHMDDIFVYSKSERHELFGDLLGKSWHGTSTKVFTVIDHNLYISIVIIAAGILSILYLIYKICVKISGNGTLKGYLKVPTQLPMQNGFHKVS